MRCEIAVDIDSCPDHVWAVITDLTRWPRWTTAVRDAALLGGGTLALHGAVRLRAPRLPERTWRVVEYQARRHRFALRSEGIGGRSHVRFALGPPTGSVVSTGEGARTRLVVAHDRVGWIGEPVGRLTASAVQANLRTLADDLKAHCETRRRAGVAATTG